MWKYEIKVFYILKKTYSKAKGKAHSAILFKRYTTLNELVVKNTLMKK